ncbi:MAG: PAS domain-containing protein [Candidatus Aureabacteria bacterium]|nr:PAS domain-containing protein [Candidatus Auribacterota bacterium]
MRDDIKNKTSDELLKELDDLKKKTIDLNTSTTMLKKVEDALFLSEQKYKILVETALDAIFTLSIDGTFISVNNEACRALNRKAEEIIGKNMSELFPKDIAEIQMRNIRTVFETGEPIIAIERKTYTARGKRWYNTSLVPIKNKRGIVVFVFGIARDITDLKNIKAE